MSDLQDWVDELVHALGVDREAVDLGGLLDVARDAAHGIARPAAPVTTFLMGLAAGRAGGGADDVAAARRTVDELIAARQSTNSAPE